MEDLGEYVEFSKRISRKFCSKIYLDYTDDIEAEGFVGLVKAYRSYDPQLLSFKSWAAFKIRSEIKSYIVGQFGTKKGCAKRNATVIPFEDDILCKEKNVEERLCIKEEVKKFIKRLPLKWRNVVYLYYFGGLTLKEIGDRKGYTRANASRIHKDSIKKMRGKKYK